ncbi:hypothetical protein VE02_09527 [Pseudogymnoascus sp. 03VT05]|nr:hypothetical protein VE02_09527 [Pseudogymnoascus sp. 03VT05]
MSSRAYYNGNIYTVNSITPWAEAFIVSSDGIFTTVGSSKSILTTASEKKLPIVDLKGVFIMPGIHDAHTHLLSASLQKLSESAIGFDSNEQTLARKLKEGECHCAYAHTSGDWLIGNYYDQHIFPDGKPDRKYLDEAFPNRPVIVRDPSCHNILVNTAALKRAGYDLENPQDPHGGSYIRRENGEITGELVELAATKVWLNLPKTAVDHAKRALAYAVKMNNQFGITSCQEASANTVYLHAIQQLEREGRLTCDIATHIVYAPENFAQEELKSLHALIEVADRYKSAHVNTHFVKFWMDGAPLSPHFTQCDLVDGVPDESKLLVDWHTLLTALERYDSKGYTCKIHCAGEGSTRKALDAIDIVRKKNPKGPKHELAHLNAIHPDDIPRFKTLRVTGEMSPAIWHDHETIAAARGKMAWPFEELLAAGASLTIGTDWFLPPTPNLFPALAALLPRLGVETIMRLITLAGAEAVGREKEIGSIEEGKKANFIQVDRNLLSCDSFGDSIVEKTWFEGKLVWDCGKMAKL